MRVLVVGGGGYVLPRPFQSGSSALFFPSSSALLRLPVPVAGEHVLDRLGRGSSYKDRL